MLDIARVLADTDQRATIVPASASDARHAARARDGAARRHSVGRRGRDEATPASTPKRCCTPGSVSFMEGAMLYGVFHGDLHGGNLMVQPDGRTVLMDFGITGRLDESKRLAFLMLLVGATSGDTMGQLRALRDLGAFPPDTDLEAVFQRPRARPHGRPHACSRPTSSCNELQDLTKKLLAYGARAPKELMLFVKNMMFLDGAIARLAPDLDILEESRAGPHRDRCPSRASARGRARDRPALAAEFDMQAVKAAMGLSPDVETAHLQRRARATRDHQAASGRETPARS